MGSSYHQFLEEHWDNVRGITTPGSSLSSKLSPFWLALSDSDESKLLDWLESTLSVLEDAQEERASQQLNNVRFYHALEALSTNPSIRAVDKDGFRITRDAQFVMNHARDFVRQSVARLMRYSPNISVLPLNNEYGDRLGARLSKRIIDNIFFLNDIRDLSEEALTEGKICGETFIFVEYDPYAGDRDTTYSKVMDMKTQLSANSKTEAKIEIDETGKEVFVTSSGESVPLDVVKRTGEVVFEHPLPWMVFHEPQVRWKDVNYIFKGKFKHIEEVRAENPGIEVSPSATISPNKNREGSYGPGFKYGEWVIEYEFFHRGNHFLDNGYYVRFIKGTVLRQGPNPYSHRGLPVVRWTDIDDPINAHGRSFLEDLRPPLVLFNRLLNFMYRSVAIASAPKLLLPTGSCNPYAMSAGPFIVEYQPPHKPEIVTFNAISNDVFGLSDKIMNQATMLSGTFGPSRGEVMPNARAASILNFYEEQESEKESGNIAKYSKFIEKLARYSLGVAGDFYRAEDGRTIRVVGKTNAYKVKKLEDVSKLSGPYDVKVERTTALAESRQGRIDQISTLSQMPLSDNAQNKPGLFTREQILKLIEVADTSTFFEMATAAVEKADSENEDMFEGTQVAEPSEWEAHLIHWNSHFQFMQSREFTDTQGLPEEVRNMFIEHFGIHEMWMYKRAQKSLPFASLLMENVYFPAVFDIGDQPKINQIIMLLQQPPMPPQLPPELAGPVPGPEMGGEGPMQGMPPDQMPESDSLPPSDTESPEPLPSRDQIQ